MKTEAILEIAAKVRAKMERVAKKERSSPDLEGLCARASLILKMELEAKGIRADLALMQDYAFGSHVFLIVEDHILDITATQFSRNKWPPVLFCSTEDKSVRSKDWWSNWTICEPEELAKITCDWPEGQQIHV